MTHSAGTDSPSSPDLRALRARNQEARARAAELRVQVDARRRQCRELTDRGERRAPGPGATELAELRTRAEAAEDRAHNLQRALASNRRIGILIERLRVPEEQAFELLRQESMRRNLRLAQVAEQVLYTGAL
ncbi:ANTAR domain-containing protein [Geodermatophilus sp. URMC 61]|uniref:ANTAR domain-containing protein n=1 Tax=Geodermatophilus sp. URMC 61 TaxID=3423411 RepID=UPI00406D05D5